MDPKLLPDLLVFLEVARTGSISEAARRLHTVQTNVTARVKKLEAGLGTQLLDRGVRGSRLTAAGEALVPLATRLDGLLDEVGAAFQRSSSRGVVLLRLGAIETVVAARLPWLLEGCREQYPFLEFAVTSGSSLSLLRMLEKGHLDAAFISYPAPSNRLRTELVFREELVLIAPKEGPGDAEALDGSGLTRRYPLLVQRLGCSYTEKLISYLSSRGAGPRLVEAGTLEGVIGFVEQGLGVAVVPRTLVEKTPRRVKLVPLTELGEERLPSVYLVSAGERSSGRGLALFVHHCRPAFTIHADLCLKRP